MVELWTSKIGGNVTELSTQGTTTGTGTWLSVTSMRDSTHVYNNGQAAPVHQHSGYSPLHAHGICLTAHTHPGNSTRPKSKHTKSYCQPLTLLQHSCFLMVLFIILFETLLVTQKQCPLRRRDTVQRVQRQRREKGGPIESFSVIFDKPLGE